MKTDFAKLLVIDFYENNPELNPVQILNENFDEVFSDYPDSDINKNKLSLSLLDFYIREIIFEIKKEEMLSKEINLKYRFSLSVESLNSFSINSNIVDNFEAYIIFTENFSKITCVYKIEGSPKLTIQELIQDFVDMVDQNN